jgi:hypothetical protein
MLKNLMEACERTLFPSIKYKQHLNSWDERFACDQWKDPSSVKLIFLARRLHSNTKPKNLGELYKFLKHLWVLEFLVQIGNKCLSTVEEIAAAIQHTLLQNITI